MDPGIARLEFCYYLRNLILAGITIGIGFMVYPISPWLLIIPGVVFGLGFVVSTLISSAEISYHLMDLEDHRNC